MVLLVPDDSDDVIEDEFDSSEESGQQKAQLDAVKRAGPRKRLISTLTMPHS